MFLTRKIFSTSIEEEVSQEFKIACAISRRSMNDVIEEFMVKYSKEVREEKKKPE